MAPFLPLGRQEKQDQRWRERERERAGRLRKIFAFFFFQLLARPTENRARDVGGGDGGAARAAEDRAGAGGEEGGRTIGLGGKCRHWLRGSNRRRSHWTGGPTRDSKAKPA